MELKKNSTVVSSDGEKMGTLRRVVLNPQTKKVAYLVVERGLLFTEDKLVSIDSVGEESDGQVILKVPLDELKDLPNFKEVSYIPLDATRDEVDAYYWYPPISIVNPDAYPYFPQPIYKKETSLGIPKDYVALKEGAKVVGEDDKEVGKVERIITDPDTERATHLVVSRGLLGTDRKVVPTHWIVDVTEDKVTLSIEGKLFDQLIDFKEEK